MEINFFEEYTSVKNLTKINLLHFPTKLYLGFFSISEFIKAKHQIERKFKQVKQIIYWPLLPKSEGYWLSAFTKREGLQRVLREIDSTREPFPVLWDAELPTMQKQLFLTQLPGVRENRSLIHKSLRFQTKEHPLIVAEFPRSGLRNWLSRLGGASFSFSNYHRLDMLYSSMLNIPDKARYIRQIIQTNKKSYQKYSVGFGILGKGEGDPTPLITPDQLDWDLTIARDEKVKEVVLYRLSGLNQKYLKIIESYL